MFTLSAATPHADSGSVSSGINRCNQGFRKSQGTVKVISQPKLMLLNNQSAVIRVGTVTGYVAETTNIRIPGHSPPRRPEPIRCKRGCPYVPIASILDKEIAIQLTPVVTTVDKIRSIAAGSTTIEAPRLRLSRCIVWSG